MKHVDDAVTVSSEDMEKPVQPHVPVERRPRMADQPAFPSHKFVQMQPGAGINKITSPEGGFTKLEYIAVSFMQAMIADGDVDYSDDEDLHDTAAVSIKMALELIKQLKLEQE